MRALQPTLSSVRENTTFGMSRQIRANSASCGGASGILVGRRPVAGHQLPGDPPVEERAHLGEHVVEVPVHLRVDQVPGEVAVHAAMKPSIETDMKSTILRTSGPPI